MCLLHGVLHLVCLLIIHADIYVLGCYLGLVESVPEEDDGAEAPRAESLHFFVAVQVGDPVEVLIVAPGHIDYVVLLDGVKVFHHELQAVNIEELGRLIGWDM